MNDLIDDTFGFLSARILAINIDIFIEPAALLLVAALSYILIRRIEAKLIKNYVIGADSKLDRFFEEEGLYCAIANLGPAFIIAGGARFLENTSALLAEKVGNLYLVMAFTLFLIALLNIGARLLEENPRFRNQPIKSFAQVIKLIMIIFGAVLALSLVVGTSPWALLSGFGALTAILLVIFKDTLLGFVASIQIASNDLLRKGDWVEVPKFGADGDVIEINLYSVKVQNFDKTITTIPTYVFVSDAFKNWRGMEEAGGRRIKRAIYMDMNSVKMLSPELKASLQKIDLLKEHFATKDRDLEGFNKSVINFDSSEVNGRRLTNLGVFRAYVQSYLKSHPKINQNMTLIVRQLPPNDAGLGIEIYCFSSDKAWANYEAIQADIFDHILSVTKYFDLRVFQKPSGYDIERALKSSQNS